MNHRTAAPGAIALAALMLTFTTACGTEVAAPGQTIGGVEKSAPSQSSTRTLPDCYPGSADAASHTCQGRADQNRARLDFGDDGRG